MIASVTKGSDQMGAFRLIRYLLSPKIETAFLAGMDKHYHQGERVGCMSSQQVLEPMPGESAVEAAKRISEELFAWNDRYRDDKKAAKYPFLHGIISWDHNDKILPEEAVEITQEIIRSAMPGERLSLTVAHNDTKHQHTHFLVSTVCENSRIWNIREDFRLWETILEETEILHGFRRVEKRKSESKESPEREPLESRPGKSEFQMKCRTGEPSDRDLLKEAIKFAIEGRVTLKNFRKKLEERGVVAHLNQTSTGHISGISYEFRGLYWKGSTLGKSYAWKAISANFQTSTDYEMEVHSENKELSIGQSTQESTGCLEASIGHDLFTPLADEKVKFLVSLAELAAEINEMENFEEIDLNLFGDQHLVLK